MIPSLARKKLGVPLNMKQYLDVFRRHKANRLINNSKQSHVKKVDSDCLYSYLPLNYSKKLTKDFQCISEKIEKNVVVANMLNMNDSNTLSDESNKKLSNSCFAEKFAKLLIKLISENNFECKNGCYDESFYKQAVVKFLALEKDCKVDDQELLVIYAKQLIMFLKKSGLLLVKNECSEVSIQLSDNEELFELLFSSFWNSIGWSELFPSMPKVADSLNENRNILKEIFLQYTDKFYIKDLVNDYLMLSGENFRRSVLLTSFFDFSFCTWFSHFGIIEYVETKDEEFVAAKLTEFGRQFLTSI